MRDFSDWTHRDRTQTLRRAVELVPGALRATPDLVRGHGRMRRVHLGPLCLGNQPVARERHASDPRLVPGHRRFPGGEVVGPRERRQHDELGERDPRPAAPRATVASKVRCAIARQPEDERSQDVNTVFAEAAQPLDQRVACDVEALVDVLQAFRRHRLDADECPLDPRLVHGVQELRILAGLHRDLGEEHHVGRQRGQPAHQVEPLGSDGAQRLKRRLVRAPGGHLEIGQGHRIEVVVGERDEPEALAPQLDDLTR